MAGAIPPRGLFYLRRYLATYGNYLLIYERSCLEYQQYQDATADEEGEFDDDDDEDDAWTSGLTDVMEQQIICDDNKKKWDPTTTSLLAYNPHSLIEYITFY